MKTLVTAAIILAIIGLGRAEATDWDTPDYGREPPRVYQSYESPTQYHRRMDRARYMSDFGLRLYQYSQPYPSWQHQHNIQHWNTVYPRGYDRY